MGSDEDPEQVRVFLAQLGFEVADQPLDIRRSKMIIEFKINIGDHLIGGELAGQDSFHSDDPRLARGGLAY